MSLSVASPLKGLYFVLKPVSVEFVQLFPPFARVRSLQRSTIIRFTGPLRSVTQLYLPLPCGGEEEKEYGAVLLTLRLRS